MTYRIAGLTGSQGATSTCRTLVEMAMTRITRSHDAIGAIYDLADLQPSLGQADSIDALAPLSRAILETALSADLLIVGVPARRGSYPGLFKHVFDLTRHQPLAGKPVLLTASVDEEAEALMVEHQLRLLFAALGADPLPAAIIAGPRDIPQDGAISHRLRARMNHALDQIDPRLALHRGPIARAA